MSMSSIDEEPSPLAQLAFLVIVMIIIFAAVWFMAGEIDPHMSTWATLNLVAGLGGYFCLFLLLWTAYVKKNEVADLVLRCLLILEAIWWLPQGLWWLWAHTHITFG